MTAPHNSVGMPCHKNYYVHDKREFDGPKIVSETGDKRKEGRTNSKARYAIVK